MATNNQINSNFHQIAVADANANVTGVTTSGNITAAYFVGNGSALTGLAGGSNIANGTSNVSIPTANGNVNLSANGVANVLVITSTGMNIKGTMVVNSAVMSGNVTAAGFLTEGEIYAAGNVTGWNFNVDGNIAVTGISTLGAVGNVKITGGSNGQFLTTNGSGNLNWSTPSSIANGTANITIPVAGGNVSTFVGATARIIATSAGANVTGTLGVTGNMSATQLISTVSSGTAPFVVTSTTQVANLRVATATNADSANTVNVSQATSGTFFIAALPTVVGQWPVRGSTSFKIDTDTSTMLVPSLSATGNISSNTNMSVKGFTETVAASANTGTSIAPDVITGTIYNYTANSDFTFNGFTNPIAGQSGVIIITQDATGSRIMSSTMKFAGGNKTLSTAPGAVDMLCVLYNGTTYLASLAKGYA